MTQSDVPEFLYKVVSKHDWNWSQEHPHVKVSSIDTQFIHLAMREQVPHVLEKFWAKDHDVVILQLDPSKLVGRLVKEKNPGGETEYYHLYEGSIPRETVVEVVDRLEFFAGI
jgi:uncharacterized protein (DUF952 family)